MGKLRKMYQIELKIEALSPLAIGSRKPGNLASINESLKYIPGSVIRGSFASLLIKLAQEQPQPGDDFHRLFLDESAAIFHNAYPATLEIDDEVIEPNEINSIDVIPTTALSSKNNPGFKEKGNKEGVFDTLIDRFCAKKIDYCYDPNTFKEGGRVDTFSGFYCQFKDKYYKLTANRRLLTRTGINRRRATTEESILYSIEVLNEPSQKNNKEKPVFFRGKILLENQELATKLVNFIDNYSQIIRLGGATSRGLGKVEITSKQSQVITDLDTRVNNFNVTLETRWKQWHELFGLNQPENPEKEFYFTITLQSDAILLENWLQTTVITEEMLLSMCHLEDESLNLETVYSSFDYISGWNSAWGLMKDVELITNKGSVYLFSTNQKSLWIESLKMLEFKGVGARRQEGFGQVIVCSPFHSILWENSV